MNASIDTLNRSAVSQVPLELLDSIEVGIAVLDRNFTVQVWNKFLENHSAKKVDFIIGHSLFDNFPENIVVPKQYNQNCSFLHNLKPYKLQKPDPLLHLI